MVDRHDRATGASMRPEDFSPGNTVDVPVEAIPLCLASMRPEDFSPGNYRRYGEGAAEAWASMRPEDFSPGNGESGPSVWAAIARLQ